MNTDARPTLTPQLVIGVYLALLGVVLLLDRLHIVDSGYLRPLWPMFVMAIGGALLLQRRDQRGRFWGYFWTFVGAWLLLNSLGVIRVGLGELIGPAILILIGASLMTRTFCGRAGWPRARRRMGSGFGDPVPPLPDAGAPPPVPDFAGPAQSNPGGTVTLFTIMGEAKRASSDRPFRGGEMTAFMGGCVLDLRQATIPPGEEAVVQVLAVMGGHEIRVPPGWTVANELVPILGGVDDKRLPPIEPPPDSPPRLRLRGVVLMGGVVIKS